MKKSLSNYLKIGQAAKVLGVSIDTLRRWEKLGKITPIRTPGGTRLFSLATLKKVNPASIENFQAKSLTTEELLRKTDEQTIDYGKWKIGVEGGNWTIDDRSSTIHLQKSTFNPLSSIVNKLLIGSAVLSIITLLITSWITASYLTSPKETQQFFKNNVAQGLLTPFRKLAEEAVTVISPEKAKQLGFISSLQGVPLEPPKPDNVLAVTSTSPFLEVNANTQINGSLSVRDSINGLTVEATPSASTLALTSGDTTLTVTKDALLDQDVSTTSSPTFNTLNLSATKDQLIFQSGGPTGTLTWTPTVTRIITLPDATGTVILDSATQTITNKTINASSNTITNIPNSALANSKITVTAGTNLTGGGDINLGSSATISLKDSVSLSGTLTVGGVVKLADGTAAAPALTFTDDTNTGLYRIGSDKIGLITGGSATSGITIDGSGNVGIATITPGAALSVSGNVGIGFTGNSATAAPNLGLAVFGNAGIGTTSPAYKLDVIGQINGSTGLCIAGDCKTAWSGVGGYTASNGLTLSGTDFQLGGQLTRATGIDINSQNFGFLGGNVGIGTSTPDYNFKVLGTGYFSGFVGIGSSMNVTGNVGVGGSLTVSSGLSLPNSSILNSYLVNSSINVTATSGTGISVSGSPVSLGGILTLAGIDASTTVKGVASFNSTNFSVSSGAVNTIQDIATTSSPTFSALTLSGNNAALSFTGSTPSLTSGANSFSIFSGGNVGIGTSANLLGALTVRGAGTGTNIALQTYGSNLTQGLTVLDNGNVGIGTTNPTVAFQLNSGRIYLPDGTAGSPVISFTNDTNTGIYRQSSDIISIVANGQNTFTASGTSGVGRLMIGNNDPVSRFQINDDDNNPASGITFGGTASTYMQLYKSGSNKLAIMGGNVGIGTSNPTATLQVQGNVGIGYTGVAIPSNGLAVFGNVGIGTTTANSNLSIAGNAHIGSLYQNISAPANGLFVDGNVGIGATTSSNKLDVWGGARITNGLTLDGLSSSAATALCIDSSNQVVQCSGSSALTGTGANGGVTYWTGSNTLSNSVANFYWDSTNNRLGIGTSSPQYRLDVSGTGYFSGFVGIGSSLNVSGNVGIGSSLTVTSAAALSTLNTTGLANLASLNVVGVSNLTGNVGIGGSLTVLSGLSLPNSSIQNANLVNSSISVAATAGTGISVSGSPVSLGGTLTLAGIDASTTVKGVASFNSTNFSVSSGAVNTIQDIATSSSPTFSNLTLTGNLGVGGSLSVTGNVGVGRSLSVTDLGVFNKGITVAGLSNLTGNVGVGGSLTVTSGVNLSSSLNVTGNTNLSTLNTSGNITNAGVFLASDGSATAPAYSFINDTDSGLWRVGTNLVALTTGGTPGAGQTINGLSVNASGNVGIGTTSPAAKLHVVGGNILLDNTYGLQAKTNTGTIKTVMDVDVNNVVRIFGVDGNQVVRIANAGLNIGRTYAGVMNITDGLLVQGNVGIGLTTANSQLSISNNVHIGSLYQGTVAPTNGLFVDGNVGIGATTSSNKLDVWGNTRIAGTLTVDSTSSFGGNLTLASGQFLAANGSASLPSYSFTNLTNAGLWTNGDGLLLTTGGSNTKGITVTGAGNVGIGTTTPGTILHISGTSASPLKIERTNSANNSITYTNNSTTLYAGIGASDSFYISSALNLSVGALLTVTTGGSVGIGTTTPNSKLTVVGNAMISQSYSGLTVPTSGLLVEGNVGIGATTSSNKLDVWGNTRVTGTLTVDQGTTFGGNLTLSGNLLPGANDTYDLGSNTARWNNLYLGPSTVHLGTSTSDEYTIAYDTTNNRLGFNVNGSGPAEIVMDSNGNVGIGTTSPFGRITILGPSNYEPSLTHGTADDLSVGAKGGSVISMGSFTTSPWGTWIQGKHTTSDNSVHLSLNPLGGNVGIGFTSPTANLHIVNTAAQDSFRVDDVANDSTPFTIDQNGNVGIGSSLTVTSAAALSTLNTTGLANLASLNVVGVSNLTGNVGVGSSLTVTSAGVFSSGLKVSGHSDLATLSTTGNVGIGGSLTVLSGLSLPNSSIQNANLVNSSISVAATAGTGISVSGSPVSLGGTLTLAGIDASTTVKGVASFNSTNFTVSSGAVNTIQDITTSSSPTFSNLTLTGNLGVGGSLVVTGNVGVGRSLTVTDLAVFNKGITVTGLSNLTGNVGVGGSLTVTSGVNLSSSLNVTGNTNLSTLNTSGNITNAGVFLASDGSATAPAYSFINDTDSGLWRVGTNLVALTTGGTPGAGQTINGLSVNASGNVGIGTTGPTMPLTIKADASKNLLQFIGDTGNNVGDFYTDSSSIKLRSLYGTLFLQAASGQTVTVADNTNANVILASGGGNVGIGTASPTDKFIVSGGNVGIGVSSPLTALAVNGAGTIGWGLTGVAGPSNGLAVQGNVGVGTTSPLGALHVVGQCVTWDTRIRIRRRRRKTIDDGEIEDGDLKMEDGKIDNLSSTLYPQNTTFHPLPSTVDDIIEYDYLEVIIKDILPGDEVLSLNENTQEFEYQKVEKLLDMGSKGVYELTTASGRQIKTTANHPYLVHLEGEKMQLHLRGGIEHQSPIQDAGWVKVINLSVGDKIAVAEELFVESNIDQKTNNHSQRESNSNSGIGIENIKFLVHNELLSKYAITNENIARNISIVNTANLFNPFSLEKLGTITTAANQPADKLIRRSANTDLQAGFVTSIYPTLSNQFMSVNQFMWDEIVSIKYLGYEHVYDLQIENTHNFLANDIVAHNTYINGNLGVGAYSGLTVPTNGLAVSGNVGIGTTTANSNLSIAGNAHIGSLYQNISAPANGLFVDGNVGIGATTSSNKLDVWGGARITNGLTLEGLSSSAATALCINSSNQVVQCSGSSALTGTGANGGVTYWTGSNTLSNSVANFYWDPTNYRLGIGTSNPQTSLYVTGNAMIGYSSGAPSSLVNGLAVSGNVGIGTTGPTRLLHIRSSSPRLKVDDSDGIALLLGAEVGDAAGDIHLYDETNSRTILGYFSTGPKVSLLPSGGNVGIGFTSPTANLHIVNTAAQDSFRVDDVANDSTPFTIDQNGNVGIGSSLTVTSAAALSTLNTTGLANLASLNVVGVSNLTGNVGVGSSLTVTSAGVFSSGLKVSGHSDLATLSTTGNVGIGGSLTVLSGLSLPNSSIQNANLVNSSISVAATAGTGISVSGSPVSLGGTLTLAGIDASTSVKGVASFNSTNFSVSSGAVNTIQDITTSSSPTFSNLTLTGNLGVGGSLSVTGNVGVGRSLSVTDLAVFNKGINVTGLSNLTGNVGVGESLTVTSGVNLSSSLNVTGNTNLSTLNTSGNITNAGVFLASDGSATAPAYSFINDTDSGLWRVGTNLVALTTGGTPGAGQTINGLSVNASGNVGIGTTGPQSSLTLASGKDFALYNTADETTNYERMRMYWDSNYAYIKTERGGTGVVRSLFAESAEDLVLRTAAGRTIYIDLGGTILIRDIDASYATRATIDSSTGYARFGDATAPTVSLEAANGLNVIAGNVGIGFTSPDRITQIASDINIAPTVASLLGANGSQFAITGSTANNLQKKLTLGLDTTDNYGVIQAGNTDGTGYNLSLNPGGGNVGIGTTTPGAKLEVSGGNILLGNNQGYQIKQSGGTAVTLLTMDANNVVKLYDGGGGFISRLSGGGLTVGYENTNAPSGGMIISGNVGIGLTTANSQLSVSNNVHIGSLYQGTVAPTNGLFVDGNVGIGATTSSNKLDIWGNTRLAGTLTVDSTSTFGGNLTLSGGQFLALNGTATLPSFSFTNSTSTGMYSPSVNALSLVTNGASTPALTITAGGNVGIGTTAPFGSTGGYSSGNLAVLGRIHILDDNNTSTAERLNLRKSRGTSIVQSNDEMGSLEFFGWDGDSFERGAYITSSVDGTPSDGIMPGRISFTVQDTSGTSAIAMRIKNNGYIGIGTTVSPDRPLQINSSIDITSSLASLLGAGGTQMSISGATTNSTKKLVLGLDTTDNYGVIQAGINSGTPAAYDLSLQPAGGNVGIGTTSPGTALDLRGNLTILAGSDIRPTTDSTTALNIANAAGTDFVTFDTTNSRVGIGTASPSQKLDLEGALEMNGNNILSVDLLSMTGWKQIQSSSTTGNPMTFITSNAAGNAGVNRLVLNSGAAQGSSSIVVYEPFYGGDTSGANLYLRSTTNATKGNIILADDGGNVGIGTASPVADLHLEGDATSTAVNFLSTGAAGGGGLVGILDNGNVGIGNSSPSKALDVTGSIRGSSQFLAPDGTAAVLSYAFTNNTNMGFYRYGSNIMGTAANGQGGFYLDGTSGTGRVTIDYLGAAASKFHIQNDGNNATSGITLGTSTTTWMQLYKSGSNKLAIMGGNVGIGTSNPTATLQVQGNVGIGYTGVAIPSNGLAVFGNVGIGTTTANSKLTVVGNAMISQTWSGISVPTSGLFVEGNVGIGATTSSNLLDVWGNAKIAGTLTVDSTSTFGGNLTLSGGQFLALNGTSSLPSYSFTNSTSTGIYSPSTNALALVTNGASTPALTITAGGNVGIGTTSPKQELSITGQVNFDATTGDKISLYDDRIDANNMYGFGIESGTLYSKTATVHRWYVSANADAGVSQKMELSSTRLYVNGNIGIGFTSPDRLLQVASDINITSSVALLLGANGSQFSITGSTAANLQKKLTLGIDTTDNYGVIQAGNLDGTGYNLSLNPGGGNVGIGTTTANYNLTVVGTTNITGNLSLGSQLLAPNGTSTLPSYSFTNSTSTGMYSPSANALSLVTNGASTPALTITAGGNVGIGTTNPTTLLQIEKTISGTGITTFLRLDPNSTTDEDGAAIDFAASSSYLANRYIARIAGVRDGTGATSSLRFYTETGSALQEQMRITPSGNIGIGFTTPDRKLQLGSDINITSSVASLLGANGSQFSITGSTAANLQKKLTLGIDTTDNYGVIQAGNLDGTAYNLALNPGGGNVGIGTTSPKAQLEINSSSPTITLSGGTAVINGNSASQLHIGPNGTYSVLYIGHNSTGTIYVGGVGTTATTRPGSLYLNAGTYLFGYTVNEKMRLTSGGNLGIGTSNPGSTLAVSGNGVFGFGGTTSIAGPSNGLAVSGNIGIGTTTTLAPLHVQGNGTNSGLFLNGNVGIGTTSPAAKFEVSSGTVAPWSRLNAGDSTFTVSSSKSLKENFNLVSGTGILDKMSNVPVYTFDFINGSKDVMGLLAEDFNTIFGRGDTSAINYQEVIMANWLGTQSLYQEVISQGHSLSTQGVTLNKITAALSVAGGNVGIGTTSPNSALDVIGNVTVSGRISSPLLDLGPATIASSSTGLAVQFTSDTVAGVPTTFQIKNSLGQNLFSIDASGSARLAGTITTEAGAFDVAEDYNVADDSIEAGDVVSISSSSGVSPGSPEVKEPGVEKSSKPYDNTVIGIISTKPGITLSGKDTSGVSPGSPNVLQGSNEVNGKPVALTGRVPVKVSTENGAINVGDYLTSSSTPGVAMKATKPGTVIGKALESFDTDGNTPGVENCAYTPGVNAVCGKILMFINISFADPGNFLTSLSLDDQGNMIIPKIRTSSLLLDPSVASASGQLTANSSFVILNENEGSLANASLTSNDNMYYDLTGKIASLEDRIAHLEGEINKHLPGEQTPEATSSATASAQMTVDSEQQESTSSASVSVSVSVSNCTLYPETCTLNLTPPDILLANNTSKVNFGSFEVSEATVSGMLTAYQAQIQDNFKVFGETTLSDTLIAGNLTVDGTLSIENGSEINVIGYLSLQGDALEPQRGVLYLQKSPLAQGLDIFNGKVTIDKNGKLVAQEIVARTVTTNKLIISNTEIASSSATPRDDVIASGAKQSPSISSAAIPSGQTKVAILTNQITPTSKVFITLRTSSSGQAPYIELTEPGVGFVVSIDNPVAKNIDFDWWIVEVKE